MSKMGANVAVIGSGSWATALVKLLAEAENSVRWWMRHEQDVAHVKQFGHNPKYLTDVVVDLTRVIPTNDLAQAIAESDFVFLVVPSAFLQSVLLEVGPESLKKKIFVSGIKGIIPGNNLIITDYLNKEYGIPGEAMAILAGPCHAEEIALEKKSYLTIGAENLEVAKQVANLVKGRYVHTSLSEDLYGLEYSAILKNIIAIACGMAHGIGYGDNFTAVLISNALLEVEAFLHVACDLKQRDINQSGYVGDVLVTCYSQFSRNRTFGTMIGRGYSVKSAQFEMNMVAEGYYSCACMHDLAKSLGASLPICEMVYRILYEKSPAKDEFKALEARLS